jgi:hypothetical protein
MQSIKFSLLGVMALVLLIGCSDDSTSPVQLQTDPTLLAQNLTNRRVLTARGYTKTEDNVHVVAKFQFVEGGNDIPPDGTFRIIVSHIGDVDLNAVELEVFIKSSDGSTSSGGGPFHIDKLKVKKDSVSFTGSSTGSDDLENLVSALRDENKEVVIVVTLIISSSSAIDLPLKLLVYEDAAGEI